MRQNSRIREQYELSLDGKQVAAIVVGALVVLGAVFVLGLNVGRQLAASGAPPRPENPLAALDRQPTAAPAPPEKEPKLSFHEALTGGAAATPPIAEARPKADPAAPATGTALNASPRPPTPAPAPTATRAATATRTGTSPRVPAAKGKTPSPPKDPMAVAVAKVASLSTAGGSEGRFAVQVGATQVESEAQRIQRRLAAEGARVVVADVPGKGRWYRIKVGSFESRAEAEQRRAALAAQGVKGFVTDAR